MEVAMLVTGTFLSSVFLVIFAFLYVKFVMQRVVAISNWLHISIFPFLLIKIVMQKVLSIIGKFLFLNLGD